MTHDHISMTNVCCRLCHWSFVSFLLLLAACACADDRLWRVYPNGLPAEANAVRFNIDACLPLLEKRTDPASKAEWDARRGTIDLELRKALGLEPRPEKTPLYAQITGRADRDTYTIENLVFQSRPHFYVTANIYKPKNAKEPLPAIVVTAGHAREQGKNYDIYRTAQLRLVHQGFLVLAYDPIGQGERRLRGYDHAVSYPALMVGQCNLTYMIWDTVRALDYLESRKDVDPKRIGVSGNSGGGLNTMFAMPFEPRFAAGASFCCLCSNHAWIKYGGNHCICNHLPGICRQMEQFELVGLCSPRPFMAGNGTQDPIFPVAGVRDTIRRAKRIYGFDGVEDHLALREAPAGHGWSQPLREAAYGWFARWLQNHGDGSPIAEQKIELEDWKSKDLQCSKDGKLPADAKSYVDLIREEAARQIAALPPAPSVPGEREAWISRTRKRLWEVLGGQPEGDKPTARSCGSFTWKGCTVERLAIQTEPGMEVPALLFHAKIAAARAPAVVWLDDDGKIAAGKRPDVTVLLKAGTHVLALDPRATGEGALSATELNHAASDAIVLGRPLLAQQAWDIIAAVRYLAGRSDQISLHGRGKVGLIATLAGALSDDIHTMDVVGAPASFADAIADPLPLPLWAYAPNILSVADISQLRAMHGKN
jgi:hypothetical protein